MSFYVATLLALAWLGPAFRQWAGLCAAAVATAGTVAVWERGRWSIGVFVRPGAATRDFVLGTLFGAVLVGSSAAAVALSTELRHVPGSGFPWAEVAFLYFPAAVHEELLFRGYPLQKLLGRSRGGAILLSSAVFAALHSGNAGVTPLALLNVFLGGVVLAFAYVRTRGLWFPIGLHLAWNVVAGPVLGDEVSGFPTAASLLAEAGNGTAWLTGGAFGIEGSVWMTAAECVAIAILSRRGGNGRAFGMNGRRDEIALPFDPDRTERRP